MSNTTPLVIYSMSYYSKWLDGVVNRNFHIAEELEASGRFSHILFFELLPFNIFSAFRSVKQLYSLERRRIASKLVVGGRLFFISENRTLFAPAPAYYFLSATRKLAVQKAVIHTVLGGRQKPIAWSYNPLDLTFLNKELFATTVFDTVDDWRHHSAYVKKRSLLTKNYQIIADSVDFLFVVSDYLEAMFLKEYRSSRAIKVPNTSNLTFLFAPYQVHKNSVVYLGTIESRFDCELVEFLVSNNRTKHFTFIGPVWKPFKSRFEKLLTYGNVTYLGEKRFATDVQVLLPTFDAGIIPHHQSRFSQSNDPLKIYDYLSAGLPVVSTIKTSEDSIADLVYYADTPETFDSALDRALAENSEKLVKERKRRMKALTWKSRTDTMMRYLAL